MGSDTTWCCVFHNQDSRVQESRDGNAPALTISVNDPRVNILLPVPVALCSADLRHLSPRGGSLPQGT
jgi:hypothetical protein